jgi:hypothetical protein
VVTMNTMYHYILSSTLKMEAISSSETSVDFHRTARRYIPEDRDIPRVNAPNGMV